MVSKENRTREYHARAPHKEGCMCAPCKTKRGVGEVIKLPPAPDTPPPAAVIEAAAEVPVGSLQAKDLFELNGQRHRVGEKTGEICICAQLAFRSGSVPGEDSWALVKTVSLGYATRVIPIAK